MPKPKTLYLCTACGESATKWHGQCPSCNAWNSIATTPSQFAVVGSGTGGYAGTPARLQPLDEVSMADAPRISTCLGELDRVLGGGLVPGSVALIGGAPGVGKSTLLLQAGCMMHQAGNKIIYVSGEESPQQLAMRAKRLQLPGRDLLVLTETVVENICQTALVETPAVIIIDSIQTMHIADLEAAPGSVSQVRESAAKLTRFAKQTGICILLIGHVTKTGDLAGPRVLEHIIDVVCSIEGGTDSRYRMVRATKNRFGAVNELGFFAMTAGGMKEVTNPSALFLSHQAQATPGSVIMPAWEGSRPLLVEIQALLDDCQADYPRRFTMGLEQNRLVMLLAVLHRHGRLATAKKDVFINVVGGIRITEPAADLAVLLAITSSLMGIALPRDVVVFGEVGLAGEVRPVTNGQERIREAAKQGFTTAVVPQANASPGNTPKGLRLIPASRLEQALAAFHSPAAGPKA